jgi:carbon-monoxide dehydrogenase large subunit
VQIEMTETPSPFTPGGMKGMGEGGTNGAFCCVANAVAAALPDVAPQLTRTPLTPTVIWSALHQHS